jgi:hypothetical protein
MQKLFLGALFYIASFGANAGPVLCLHGYFSAEERG